MAAFPASGNISLSAINTVFGRSSSSKLSANDPVRVLAGVSSGTVRFSDVYGKSLPAPQFPATSKKYMANVGTLNQVSATLATLTTGGVTYTAAASNGPQYGNLVTAFGGGLLRTFNGMFVKIGTGFDQHNPYTGTVTTTSVTGATYKGYWLQLSMSPALCATRYFLTFNSTDIPSTWYVFGSYSGADGTWVLLDGQVRLPAQWTTQVIGTSVTYNMTNTQNYPFYRWVVTHVSAYSGGASQTTCYLQHGFTLGSG